jgi:hypothetical protein
MVRVICPSIGLFKGQRAARHVGTILQGKDSQGQHETLANLTLLQLKNSF